MNKYISDRQKARKLLEIYRGEVDDFFKLWPTDKTYFFSKDGKAFLAYGIRQKSAICMGEPVGSDPSIEPLLREFKQFCQNHGLLMAFVQVTDKYTRSYHELGLHGLLIGADAAINLSTFTSVTMHNKYFRNIVNRFEKHQFVVETHEPPHTRKLIDELQQVSDSWSKLPNRKEWSFLTGRFDNDYLQHVTLHVLRDKNNHAQAFANELPSYKPGTATIDLMRHRRNALNNSIDYLLIRVMLLKNQEGYTSFNLGLSPLDGKPFVTNIPDRLLMSAYKISDKFISFHGLHQFKSKYEPIWEPRYIWYQGSSLRLPSLARAVAKLLHNS